jgi:hypothetical protein
MHHQSQTLIQLLYPITAQKKALLAREKRQLQKDKENERILKQMEEEKRTRDNVETPAEPTLTSSDTSSSDDDESSEDETLDKPPKRQRRRVLDDLDDEDEHNTEISEDVEDVSDITTATHDTGITGQTGAIVVTPRRIHNDHETYQEAGVDRSGNAGLLRELYSRN